MLGAIAGATLDERLRLGYTTWRTACRSAGLRIPVLVEFTVQLLPLALIGLLAGGLVVLLAGSMSARHQAHASLAAHLACAMSLPVAVVLCAVLPPVLMLVADALLATLAACAVFLMMRKASHSSGLHP